MIAGGNEALSNILGWMSISCWIVVYSPQIIENYRLQSGEGLSVSFVLIWLAGDLCNLLGAVLAGLLPTVIILGAYYTACDLTLLSQIYYYRWVRQRKAGHALLISEDLTPSGAESEYAALLTGGNESSQAPVRQPMVKHFMKYAAIVMFVLMTGVVAWAIDEGIHRNKPHSNPEEIVEWKSQVLGWASAILFLGARIPQILKNLTTRCEGLSPALFIFSIAGNSTYVLSILAVSLDTHHLIANGAWLLGGGLPVFFDLFVLFQFFYYQTEDRRLASSGGS